MIVREARLTYRKVGEAAVVSLRNSEETYRFLQSAWLDYPEQESFIIIPLSRKNRPIKGSWVRVTLGTANASLVHPREVFRPAILSGASALIVAHNHPSGDPAPSAADMKVTRRLREAATVIDIDLLDHVICGTKDCDPIGRGYYSFSEAGLI